MTKNKNNIFSDLIIKQAVQEDMKNTPEMPYSEDETWRMIQKKMRNEPFKKRKGRKFTKLSLIAASILLVLSFVQVQSGNAFGWLTKYVLKSQGTITNVDTSNLPTNTDKAGLPSPDEVEIMSVVKRTEHMNISEAQEVTSFNIIVPKFVPEGFTLNDVLVVFEGDKKSNEVTLIYKKDIEKLEIKQINANNQYGYTFGVDNEDTLVKKVDVFNQEATLLFFKDKSKILLWDNMQLRFSIYGNLTEEELLKIAHSM